MSEVNNVNTVGTQITGNEVADAEAILQSKIASEIARQRAADGLQAKGQLTATQIEELLAKAEQAKVQPQVPSVYKVPIGGQEYTFNSLEELGQQVTQALNQRTAPAPVVEAPKPAGYDEAEFERLLKAEGGTPKALEYAFQHSGLAQKLAAQEAQIQALKMKETARDVQQLVPGFKPNPQQLQILDNIRQQLGGDPSNPYSWEAAAAVAKTRGLIPEIGQPAVTQTPGRSENTQTAAPYLGRSSADTVPGLTEADAWSMDIDRLKKIRQEIASARGTN